MVYKFRVPYSNVDGFIVHYGWLQEGAVSCWIRSDWIVDYVTMQINHTHTDVGLNIDEEYNHILKCAVCNRTATDQQHFYDGEATQIESNNGRYYHTKACVCSAVKNELHTFDYIQVDTINHKAACICGYSFTETHWFKQGRPCLYCGTEKP